MFAIISHELRISLALFLSPLEPILEENETTDSSTTESSTDPPSEAPSIDGERMEDKTGKGLLVRHRKKLETVCNNAIPMLQMVNGLLDCSQVEIGEIEINHEPTKIDERSRTIIKDVASLTERKGLEFEYESTVDQRVVNGDRYLYEGVLFNVLSNAITFTSSGGTVWVILSQEENQLQPRVRDAEEPVPEEELDDIFKDFRQIDASSTRLTARGWDCR